MENLIKMVTLENEKELQRVIKAIQNKESYTINSYLTNLRQEQLEKGEITREKAEQIAIKKATKKSEKSLHEEIEKIVRISNAKQFNSLTITIEWKKSATWGSNPTAYTTGDSCINGSSIGGCGYDKESAAVAQVLNQCSTFLKLLYTKKNDNVEVNNHTLFGYGSGYGVLPYFEGGVGTSCLNRICDSIGLEFKCISSGKSFDVYTITKKGDN